MTRKRFLLFVLTLRGEAMFAIASGKFSDGHRVFEQSDVEDTHVGYSLTNLQNIMTRFGV